MRLDAFFKYDSLCTNRRSDHGGAVGVSDSTRGGRTESGNDAAGQDLSDKHSSRADSVFNDRIARGCTPLRLGGGIAAHVLSCSSYRLFLSLVLWQADSRECCFDLDRGSIRRNVPIIVRCPAGIEAALATQLVEVEGRARLRHARLPGSSLRLHHAAVGPTTTGRHEIGRAHV